MNWGNIIGGVDLISLVNLFQLHGLATAIKSLFGFKPRENPPPTPTATSGAAAPGGATTPQGVQAEPGSVGLTDEWNFLNVFVRLNERKMEETDFLEFVKVLQILNQHGRHKGAHRLAQIMGFKGSVETKKVPWARKAVGKGANKKVETEFREFQRDINPNGEAMVVFFGEVKAKNAVAMLEGSGILNNLEDSAKLTAKETAEGFKKWLAENDTKVHRFLARICIGGEELRQVLSSRKAIRLQKAIDRATTAKTKRAAEEALQAYVFEQVEAHQARPVAPSGWSSLSWKRYDRVIYIVGGVSLLLIIIVSAFKS